MHLDIGPVPAPSASAWISYARAVLMGYGLGPSTSVYEEVDEDVVDQFRSYLDEWERVADKGGDFKWTANVDLEVVEYLVHAFYRVATQLAEAAERRGSRLMPPEGEAFYAALVVGLLDGLEAAGQPAAEFAEQLRQFWPGL